jgi:WD40 repeat protein/tetratricopeptide (TPR) repeat protein
MAEPNSDELPDRLGPSPTEALTVPPAPTARTEAPTLAPEPSAPPAVHGLRSVGDYELLEEIARGGMGVVYRARQISLNRIVALKMILAGQLASDADVHRFRSEAEAAAHLDHPNIVPIYEVGEHDGQPYFSMKLMEGGTLADRKLPLPAPEAVHLLAPMARAVHHAHQRGILHRDLKPGNILLDASGQPHVTDFGLAKQVEGEVGQTRTGAIVGTPSYMAPEQARAEKGLSTAVDTYSLGAILYECLTGQPPFRSKTPVDTILQVLEQEPIDPRVRYPAADRDLATISLKCLEKEPRRRYESPAALADDLERWLAGVPIQARPARPWERAWKWARRKPALAALAMVCALAAACLLAGGLWYNQQLQRALADTRESQQETASALATVESQKEAVEGSLSKAEAAERVARAAEEEGRKLLYTTDMRLAPFVWKDDRSTAEQLRVLLARHIPEEWMKDEGGRMNEKTGGPDSSFRLHPSSFQKPDLRGFEWYYYQHLLDHSAAVFSGHAGAVVGEAFTADGQVVTLDQNGQVRRWDVASQAEDKASRRDLPGGAIARYGILSANGRLAALALGNKVHVFETSTGKGTIQIDSASNQFRGAIFSPDNDRLVIVDDKIRWLNAASGEMIAFIDKRFDRFSSLDLSADGLTLAIAGHGPIGSLFSIFRLDATNRTVTPLARDVDSSSSSASALSPDGQRISVGASRSGEVRVYDTATGRTIAEHRAAHASPISALAFSGDGLKLATADTEGTIKIWADAQKLNSQSTALVTLKGHHGAINTLGFSSDGKRLASTCMDKTARVWDLDNAGAAIRLLERTSPFMSFVAGFSSDGQWMAVDNGNSVRLYDAATGRPVRELSAGSKSGTSSVAFSPTDHRLLAVGTGEAATGSYVTLWDIDAATELARLPGASDLPDFRMDPYSEVVGALAFSPDGKYLVAGFGPKWLIKSASSPNPLKVWDVATRRLIRRLNGHTGYCVSLDFSRDGKLLASGSGDGTVIIWSTQTWKKERTLQNPDPPSSISQGRSQVGGVAFSPDGKTLAVASLGGTVQLWEVATGELQETLKGHSSAVTAVAFSPDGRTLASGSNDQTVRLWNLATRRQLMQLDAGSGAMGSVYSLAFSPDGKHLLIGGGKTAFWSAAPIVWNDADRAADKLRLLLQLNADFQSRIRMMSENLRLHEALAKLVEGGGWRVEGARSTLHPPPSTLQAALAATQANWHASRQAWPEAALAFDRLRAADPTTPEAWLRTPGLLRLATALLHQDRPADAVMLLQGGAKWRAQDPAMFRQTGLGFLWAAEGGVLRVREVFPGSAAARGNLLPGDVVVKVNGTDTTNSTLLDVQKMTAGGVGTKVCLTVRHPGRTETADVDLLKANNLVDEVTARSFFQLLAALEKRLARDPKDARLLELRAEIAGLESDFPRQVADCTTAIKILTQQPAKAVSAPLRRLYRSRGDASVSLKKWPQAVADYARVITAATTDDALLSNQALAQANLILEGEAPATWTVLQPTDMKSKGGATLAKLPDDSILASGQNSHGDVYTIVAPTNVMQIRVIRLEALTHESLPDQGPGRGEGSNGSFAMEKFTMTAHVPGKPPRLIEVSRVAADHFIFGLSTDYWNIGGGESRPHTAVYLAKQPIDCQEGARLQLQMQFADSAEWPRHNLGRFRLSVSSDPAAFDREQKLFPVMSLSDPWQRLAAAYRIQGNEAAIDQLLQRRPKSAGLIGDLFTQEPNPIWQRAVEIYTKGITSGRDEGGRMKDEKNTDSSFILHPSSLLSRRARAQEALSNWDAAAADWSQAALGNSDGAKLLADFARRLAAGGQVSLATAHFEKSRSLYARALEAEPENDLVAPELAQLLWDKHENENPSPWTVLKPVEAQSQLGATLSILPDSSIFASGANPSRDRYRVVLDVGAKINLAAVRLEALTHPSLPGNGPGRYPGHAGRYRGTFSQKSWNVTATPPDRKTPLPLVFDNAWAGFQLEDQPIKSNGQWNITLGGEGRNCTAVWTLSKPVALATGTMLAFEMQCDSFPGPSENLGHFRLSVSSDPAALVWEQKRFAALQLPDHWARLAAAYHLLGYQQALDKLLKHHQASTAGIGDLYAAAEDWERAIAEYRKAITNQPADSALLIKLAAAYQGAGRTREAIPYLVKASTIDPTNSILFLQVATLQAWFGQDQELAATRRWFLVSAKGTNEAATAERAAKACSLLPSTDPAELEAALALARRAVQLGQGSLALPYYHMALGMAEYRSGHFAAADAALIAAADGGKDNPHVPATSAFYRAMSLFRQGQAAEARKLAIDAAAKMKPLPTDERDPLAGDTNHDDWIVWLAYKEAKDLIKLDAAPPAKVEEDKK